jgi:hypothetical protein
MSITICTFATPSHYHFQDSFYNLYKGYVDNIRVFRDTHIIGTDFYKNNQQVFKYSKYYGYFLWKPYIVNLTLDTSASDYVLYCDSNIRFNDINSFLTLFNKTMDSNGIFFVKHLHWINKDWTKRDTFIAMECDNNRYWSAHQIWSVLFGFSRNVVSKEILKEYLKYCTMPQTVTEEPNVYGQPNLEGYREHRWEQSVLSILIEKYGVETIPELEAMRYYTKVYDEELYKLKDEINKNPLAEIK